MEGIDWEEAVGEMGVVVDVEEERRREEEEGREEGRKGGREEVRK